MGYGNLTIFKMAAVRHVGFENLQFLSCGLCRHAIVLPHTKFRRNRTIGRWIMTKKANFKMELAAILNSKKNHFLMCPHSAQSLLEFCWKLIQNLFSKTVPILSKSGIFCRNLFKISPVPVKQKPTIKIFLTLSKVSSKYVQNMFKINLRSVWVLLICAQKYAQNM